MTRISSHVAGATVAVAVGLLAASAQAAPQSAAAPPGQAAVSTGAPAWTGFFGLDVYSLPDEDDYVQPTVVADRGRLHLEARYNYEDSRTASAFAGVNLAVGDAVALSVTPMVGIAFGRTAAAVPAFRSALAFWRVEASAEGEWAFAFDDEDDSFFYAWLEADVSLKDWMWVGVSSQTTKIFDVPRETQWGPVVGIAVGPLDVSAYVFDVTASRPTVIISAVVRFGAQ